MAVDDQELARLRNAASGQGDALGLLLEEHAQRLRRMVRLRLDRRLQGRLDENDVLQEAFLEATQRIDDYLLNPNMPFGLWLRFITGQKILQLHRRHLGVQARDAGREISLFGGAMPQVTSAALAARLIGRITSPSQRVAKAEMQAKLQETLNQMPPLDREIIALRHFEQLTLSEAAQVLSIKHTAACNRYVRAIEKLKKLMHPQGGEGEFDA